MQEEAEIIHRIFSEFTEGKSPYKIATNLQRDEGLTGSGGSRWYDSTVNKILKNEKYMGEASLQKTFTVDFLTKKRVKNNGQAAQYHVEDSHPPIISKEEFATVQLEFERRANLRGYSKTGKSKFTSDYAFSGKLFCQNCGSKFRQTKWGKGKNQQIVWICINHQMGGACDMKTVKEKALEQVYLRVMNRIKGSDENDGDLKPVQELKDYLMAQETGIVKFDEDIFRRFVEKVKVRFLVEVEFVLKKGVEIRKIL